jgi:hypothetical protein
MNSEKAREFFSAYHEGALEEGLAHSFERKLAADSDLKSEYGKFCETMTLLQGLAQPVPEPKIDLHEKISARLDRAAWEQKQNQRPAFLGWWRSIALGGLATVAILGALTQMPSNGPVAKGGAIDFGSPGQLQFTLEDGDVLLTYTSRDNQTVTFRDGSGKVVKSAHLRSETLQSKLTNGLPESSLVAIEISGDPIANHVALPGTAPETASEGRGTVLQLAVAAAARYRVPVIVAVPNPGELVQWKFESNDPYEGISGALAGTGKLVDKRANGLLRIEQR